jgi:acyl-CoA synthetase (AMP-forming)/AMP-acid ligase II
MLASLFYPVYFGMISVHPPPGRMLTAELADEIRHYSHATGALYTPSLLEEIVRQRHLLARYRQLEVTTFGGAPVRPHIPRLIEEDGGPHLRSIYGAIETSLMIFRTDPTDPEGEYFSFHPYGGVHFIHQAGELYELVHIRNSDPLYKDYQPVFSIFPNLDRYDTKDLWSPHATKLGLWKYRGRRDTNVILSDGVGVYAADIELALEGLTSINAALVGGSGTERPFLLVEASPSALPPPATGGRPTHDALVSALWPAISKVNTEHEEHAHVTKPRIIFAHEDRPFVRTLKGTVDRKNTLRLYEMDILERCDIKIGTILEVLENQET